MVELRKYDIKYVEEFANFRNNPEIIKCGFDRSPNPYTVEDTKELFSKHISKMPAERFLIFFNNQFCGEIGFWPNDDIFRLNAEIGYFVAEPFWGKGIATDAIKQITEYIFSNFNIIRIVAGVFEFNKASMRALEKSGFTLESIHKKAVVKQEIIQDNYIWIKLKAGV